MTAGYRPDARIKTAPETGRNGSGTIWKFAAALVVSIVLMSGIALFIYTTARGKGPDIGAVSIKIEGRDAVLSAVYDLPPGVELRSSDLDLVSEDARYPVDLGGGIASVELGVTDVASILKRGKASISGSVKVTLEVPPITMDRNLDEEIDIASYLSMNNTLEADNITIGLLGLGELRISLDFRARMRSDISIEARNTSAKIVTAFASTPGRIDSLNMNADGIGDATVRVPTISIAPLLLGNNLIVVDFWGFIFSFHYPING